MNNIKHVYKIFSVRYICLETSKLLH